MVSNFSMCLGGVTGGDGSIEFLQRVSIAYAERCTSYRKSVRLSV